MKVQDPRELARAAVLAEYRPSSDSIELWASHDVQFYRSGQKRLRHPVVGQLDLDYEFMEPPCEPGLHLNVYTAAAGTPSADALKLLASWAASHSAHGDDSDLGQQRPHLAEWRERGW